MGCDDFGVNVGRDWTKPESHPPAESQQSKQPEPWNCKSCSTANTGDRCTYCGATKEQPDPAGAREWDSFAEGLCHKYGMCSDNDVIWPEAFAAITEAIEHVIASLRAELKEANENADRWQNAYFLYKAKLALVAKDKVAAEREIVQLWKHVAALRGKEGE